MRPFGIFRASHFLALLAAVAGGAATFARPAYADEPASPTEALLLGDVPQVLTATRLRQPLSETPASVTIIDRKEIEASGVLDIVDLLRLVPGFQVGHVNGQQTTVTSHGLSDAYARRMQVLIDGRSAYNAFFGGVIWDDLPLALEDIERIEVTRGPNGVTYGANAFSGVINIITRRPADVPGTFVKTTFGSADTHAVTTRYGGGDETFRFRGTAAYRGDDGLPNNDDGKQVRLFSFRGEGRLTEHDRLDIQFGHNGGPRDQGTPGNTMDPLRKAVITSEFEQLRWTRARAGDEQWNLQFYHDYYKRADTYRAALGPLTATLDEDAWWERYDLELSRTLTAGRDARLVWGAEARLDRVTGDGWFGNPSPLDFALYRLFSNAELRPARNWIVNAGVMLEHNDAGTQLSPRLALNYHVVPGQTLRASATRAYRSPSAFESSADVVIHTDLGLNDRLYRGNDALRPERITAYEVGYLGEFPRAGLQTDVKLFREQIRNIIVDGSDNVSAPADPYNRFVNDGHTDTDGAELALTYRPTPATRAVFAYAYAHQRGRLLTQVDPPQYADSAPYTPVHTRSLLLEHRPWSGASASLGYYKVSHFSFFSPGDATEYHTLDLRVAQKFRLASARAEASVVGQNLQGEYYDFQHQAVLDQRVFFNLSLELR